MLLIMIEVLLYEESEFKRFETPFNRKYQYICTLLSIAIVKIEKLSALNEVFHAELLTI
jgi:hypothetical protein